MKKIQILLAVSAVLSAILFSGCGDSAPFATKLAVALTQTRNESMQNRAPEIVVKQFFRYLEKADFQKAAAYCDGNMKLFMEYCIANQKMQSPAEKGFWDNEFRSFSGIRLEKITWVESKIFPAEGGSPEVCVLTCKRAGYKEVLLDGSRPRVFELSFMLFPAKVTGTAEEKKDVSENMRKDFTVVDIPECLFQITLTKNSSNEFKIVNFSLLHTEDPEDENGDSESQEYDQEFMNLTDEPEKKEEKKPAPHEEQGMAGDDFGFGEL